MSTRNYVIHPIPLTKFEMPTPRMLAHTSYHQILPMVEYVWYLEGTRQNVIVDSGVDEKTLKEYGYKSETVQTLNEGLAKLGASVNDIDVIIATHLHMDHMKLAHEFSKAKVIVQRKELEFASNPHPLYALTYPAEVIKGLDYEVVDGDTRFEDGINLLFTPGHSEGGQSVAVRTAQGTAIITGFCCINANFDPVEAGIHQWGPPEAKKRPFTIPGMNVRPMDAYDSMVRIIRLADLLIPVHEYSIMNKTTIP
jgi:N-acyl homoserine lactone hydrolase